MSTILAASANGMVFNQQWMDAIGHNLANVNTPAFKHLRVLAEGTAKREIDPDGARFGVPKITLDLIHHLGAPQATDDPLHFAITDDSFFRVTNFDGESVLTRYGGLSADSAGNILGFRGRLLDPPIAVPPGTTGLGVDQFGNISGIDEAGARQVYGQLTFVRVLNAQGLETLGDGLYRGTVNNGPNEEGTPGSPGFAAVVPGAVEGSNVEIAEEFTSMIIAQRAYQASARTFKIGDEMLSLATNLTR